MREESRAEPFPRRYGASDTLGAANEIGPEQVRAAAALIKTGQRLGLAQVLSPTSPARRWRYWRHTLVVDHLLPSRYAGSNGQSFLEESVAGALHSGTHLDGLAHIGIRENAYNGLAYESLVEADGLLALGIDAVPPFVTRGVLLDIAALRGRPALRPGEPITVDDLETASSRAGIEVRKGDIVIVHTGWGALWDDDDPTYSQLEPGIDVDAATWCTDRRVSIIGADNWGVEVFPSQPDDLRFPVHQHCLTRYGCYLLENVRTQEIATAGVTEFCCVISPVRLRGASASMVNPVAIL
jgi:kynurenine formamidase